MNFFDDSLSIHRFSLWFVWNPSAALRKMLCRFRPRG